MSNKDLIISKFKVIFDNGKPYEVNILGLADLEKCLKNFYEKNKDNGYFNAEIFLFNESIKVYEDISESQTIQEIIEGIENDNLKDAIEEQDAYNKIYLKGGLKEWRK